MFIRDTAVAIVVGMVLLLLLSRLIGRVQFSLSTAFWCSFIGHIFISIVGLFTGWLFAYHIAIGFLIALAIGWAFQTILFQIAVRAKSGTLQQWRAAILSGVVILGDFLVASPLIAFWEHLRQ
jgi:magnesium-transporting ATPase (P-type)